MNLKLKLLTNVQTRGLSAKALAASVAALSLHMSTPACLCSVCMAGSPAQKAPRLSHPVT